MNINIGKLIKKNKIILYLVIIIGSLLIFKHIYKNNTIEGYQNKDFGYDKPKNYSNPDGNLKWAAYKICTHENDETYVINPGDKLPSLNASCPQDYMETKKINYGWVDGTSEKWKKIEWEYNKYKSSNWKYLEMFKESISQQNNTKWLSIINDDNFVAKDNTNKISPLKQLDKEYNRITTIWSADINVTDKNNKDDYSYYEKLWNTYPKKPRNMSPYDILDKFITGEIKEDTKIIRIGYKDDNGKIIKNNYDNHYPLAYFQKQHNATDTTSLFPWLKQKIANYRHNHESKYFWYKNGKGAWNGPYDKFQLLRHYQNGKINDKTYIIRSTENSKNLNKVDKNNVIQFYQLGENLAETNNNNRKLLTDSSIDNSWDGVVGIKTKNGNTTTSTDLYNWLQKNKSTKENGSWPYHQTFKTIDDLNHPLYGSITDVQKSDCISQNALNQYGKPIANFGKCNKTLYPHGDTCYYKKTFWGFQDKGICYPLSCTGQYNPNKKCRSKYKNSDIPKCLQEDNLQCTPRQTEFNGFGITDGSFDIVNYKKKFTVNGKETNYDKPYNFKKKKCTCICKPGWSGDKCDIPVSWENRCKGATNAPSCKKNVPQVTNVQTEQLGLLELIILTIVILIIIVLFLYFLFYKKGDHTIDKTFKQIHTNFKKGASPAFNPRLNKAFAKV